MTAPEEHRDELPEELDPSAFVGPYMFPNNNRRRVPAVIYVIMGVAAVVAWVVTRDNGPVLVNGGLLAGGIGLVLFGLYAYQAGFDLEVDERDALVAATRTVGFPVGHASAQLGWRGLRSKPTWRILLYSNEEPPTKRGLVLVDGIRGDVLQHFVEDNPEDWTNSTK
ncbi:MAG TPA: hypothetical protein VFV00_05395 [Acidimicrobiales bacterium]|nr:hypothetical protein [Acidimicrobiales bacterium]